MVEWRNVVGFEGLYKISEHGVILNSRGQTKTQTLSNSGYLRVTLYKDSTPHYLSVHRLVAKTFLDNPEDLPEVNHKDEDRLNNKVENLEWTTRRGNALHSIDKFKGSNSGTAKLNEQQVVEIVKLLGVMPQTEIAKLYGVSNHAIHKIKTGGNWGWLTGLGKEVMSQCM